MKTDAHHCKTGTTANTETDILHLELNVQKCEERIDTIAMYIVEENKKS
jgi:hypothetical protein